MHRLHESDVGQHRLFVRRLRIHHHRRRPHRVLDGVQQRQPGEHPDRQRLLFLAQRGPALHIVGQGHLFRQPEVRRQPVPHLQILLVLQPVPVDGQRHLPHLFLVRHVNHLFLSGRGPCSCSVHSPSPRRSPFAAHGSPHNAQDTHPCTSVPSSTAWRSRT